jgi:lipase chaperone LimK
VRVAGSRNSSAPGEPGAARDNSTANFEADAAGQLVTNEQTRLNIERLVALNSPDEMQRQLQDLRQSLPAPAAQRLADLVEQYMSYIEVARQTFPPGQAPSSEQDALTQVSTLHALRAQYFGPEAAQAMFGTEEESQRELLELMKLEKDPSLSLQERAERAQAHQQRLSELQSR